MRPYLPGQEQPRKLGTMVRRFRTTRIEGMWHVYDRANGMTVADAEDVEDATYKADLLEGAIGKCPKARNSIHQVDITKDPTDPTPACIMCGKAIDAEALELIGVAG